MTWRMETPSILVTGERKIERSTEKVEKGSPEKVDKESEKGKVREGLNVRKREGRRKSETPQWRKNENGEDGGEKGKEGQSRKKVEKTRSDEEEIRRSQKREPSPHYQPPSSSLLLGADLGVLKGRQGRRKSEVKVLQFAYSLFIPALQPLNKLKGDVPMRVLCYR